MVMLGLREVLQHLDGAAEDGSPWRGAEDVGESRLLSGLEACLANVANRGLGTSDLFVERWVHSLSQGIDFPPTPPRRVSSVPAAARRGLLPGQRTSGAVQAANQAFVRRAAGGRAAPPAGPAGRWRGAGCLRSSAPARPC